MVQKEKIQVVEETTDRLNRARSVVVVKYQGLTVAQISDLRNQLRDTGSELKVVKNRLTRRALETAECETLDDILTGPTALAFGYEDATAPPKVCRKFAEDHNKMEILGGLLDKQRIALPKIEALAKLPGRTELLSQMAGTMMAPARQLATAMHQAVAKLVYAMKSRADQLESQ